MERYHYRPLDSFSGTYEWIFDGTSTPFKRWLEESNDTFWVQGKAGSGKSCLMKFIVEHPRTSELLRDWASGQVTIASFFFWAAGGDMERSQLGLMQSILHQLLAQRPEIVKECVPERWSAHEKSLHYQKPWSYRELQNALRLTIQHTHMESNLCLFIDGLDEFDGDHQDLIEFLDHIRQSDKVKLCVSSRPWNIFHTAYGGRDHLWQLRLQDLTSEDMKLVISGRIQNEPKFQALVKSDEDAELLIYRLDEMAQGSFLWVSLAVKTLRRGLSEDDSLSLLLQRLDLLPPELGAMLQHMFDSIEPVYRQLAARCLLILIHHARHHDGQLYLPWLAYLDQELLDPDFGLILSGEQTIAQVSSMAERKVKAWCKDFVEVTRGDMDYDSNEPPPLVTSEDKTIYFDTVAVDFGHRTIHEFFEAKKRDGTLATMAGAGFEPSLSVCRGLVRCARFSTNRIEFSRNLTLLFNISHATPSMQQESLVPLALRLLDTGIELAATDPWFEPFDLHVAWLSCKRADPTVSLSIAHGNLPHQGAVMVLAHALICRQERLFWSLFAQQPQHNTLQARQLWLLCAICPGGRVAYSEQSHKESLMPMLGSALRLCDDEIDVNALIELQRGKEASLWTSVLSHFQEQLYLLWSMVRDKLQEYSDVLHALAFLVSRGANADDITSYPKVCQYTIQCWSALKHSRESSCLHLPHDSGKPQWYEYQPSRMKYNTNFVARYRPQIERLLEQAKAYEGDWDKRSEAYSAHDSEDASRDDPGIDWENNPEDGTPPPQLFLAPTAPRAVVPRKRRFSIRDEA